ncbi:Golgin subfamily A member 7/ERF4 family-domain-containing protein [Amylocystis lapponica]|nr:Golgin subfamily A member 7/ERF4 family-domain-containing protein [Amylocystis lapponica]
MLSHRSSASSSRGGTSELDTSAGESSRPPSPSRLAAPKMAALGLHAAPPDMDPPSPALTATDSAQDHHRDRTEGLSPLEEVDIASGDGGASWSEPDDSDTSKESMKDEPSADDTFQRTFDTDESAQAQVPPRHTPEHPLRLDVQPPTPPLWEQIEPPATGAQRDGFSSTNTRVHEFSSKPIPPSRPLVPRSSYYYGAPPEDAAFGTPPVGQIGVHHPREIVRLERDYTGGELVQFAPTYPLEFEDRITPTQFLETINAINELLISAHSLTHSFVDTAFAFLTLQLSRLVLLSHYDKEMRRLHQLIDDLNTRLYNPVGLNILWPYKVGFLFLEVEYY